MAFNESIPTVVVIGAGVIGVAVVKRLDRNKKKKILLADSNLGILNQASEDLNSEGHAVQPVSMDVCELDSASIDFVGHLIDVCKSLPGPLETVIHTTDLLPTGSSTESVYAVNLFGAANVIDAFLPIMNQGSSMVCIANTAGYLSRTTNKENEVFASAPTRASSLCPRIGHLEDLPEIAYGISKWAIITPVRGMAQHYGRMGARINSVSPGIIDTPAVHAELEVAGSRQFTQQVIDGSPIRRFGTVEDVAEVVAFLAIDGPGSRFITGTCVIVDGGFLRTAKAMEVERDRPAPQEAAPLIHPQQPALQVWREAPALQELPIQNYSWP